MRSLAAAAALAVVAVAEANSAMSARRVGANMERSFAVLAGWGTRFTVAGPAGRRPLLVAAPLALSIRPWSTGAGAEIDRCELAVAGSAGGEVAAHEHDPRYWQLAVAAASGRGDGLAQRRPSLTPPAAIVEDPADREMGMPWSTLAREAPRFECTLDAGLECACWRGARRRSDPEDPRALETGKRPDPVQPEGEGRMVRRRFDHCLRDFRQAG